MAGGTVVLKCQVKDHEDSSLQWSNPAQQTLYFGEKRGSVPGVLAPGEPWAGARDPEPVVGRLGLGKASQGLLAGSGETAVSQL